MENKDDEYEVLHGDVKKFMNEPEPSDLQPQKEAAPPPPMMTDDWEGTPENLVNDFKLTSEQIAIIAYHAICHLEVEIHHSLTTATWDVLPAEQKQYYSGIVNFFINSAANPNGHESCQALHDLMLDAKLRDGWKYAEAYSEADKTDPMLLSYKGLPPHLKARNFLFRCVVVGLVAVWKGH